MEIVIKIDDERYKDKKIEEAKKWLNKLYMKADITDEYGDMEDMQPYEEAVNMAIKALNQNTTCECEKCVIDKITSIKPKQGQWVQIYIPLPLSDSGKDCYCCSECQTHWDCTSNYCPNCGAKMISTSKDVK